MVWGVWRFQEGSGFGGPWRPGRVEVGCQQGGVRASHGGVGQGGGEPRMYTGETEVSTACSARRVHTGALVRTTLGPCDSWLELPCNPL